MRRLARFAALIGCLFLMIVPAAAAEEAQVTSGSCGENLSWSFDETTDVLTISGTGAMYDYSDFSPENRAPWFACLRGEDGVSVVIGEGVTSVGKAAFFGLDLTDPRTQSSVVSVRIADTVVDIGANAFYACGRLTEVELPNNLISLGTGAFQSCTALMDITIPSGVTSLGGHTFDSCFALSKVELPAGLKTLGEGAFLNCKALTAVDLPDGLTEIGAYAFAGAGLIEVEIPAQVEQIGVGAFGMYVMPSLPGSGYTTIACENLTAITVAPGNTAYTAQDGVLFNQSMTRLLQYPAGKAGTEYTTPGSVTQVDQGAFAYGKNLNEVTLFGGLTALEPYTFLHCTGLRSVAIPASAGRIGEAAFYGCGSLWELRYEGGVDDWSNVEVDTGNDVLNGVEILYDQELEGPTGPVQPHGIAISSVTHGRAELNVNQAYKDEEIILTVIPDAGYERITLSILDEAGNQIIPVDHRDGTYSFFMPDAPVNITVVCAKPEEPQAKGLFTVGITGTFDYATAHQELELINEVRQSRGLAAITLNARLTEAAMLRAAELAVYYSHTRPDNTDCFTVSGGIRGENIAINYRDAEEVVDGWMNSDGHRDNILSVNNRSVGIGCFIDGDGVTYWVQLFSPYEADGGQIPTDARTGTQDITAAAEHLRLPDPDSTSLVLEAGESSRQALTFHHINPEKSYSHPDLLLTYAVSSDEAVADVTRDADGAFVIRAKAPGQASISLGLASAQGEEPCLLWTVTITVRGVRTIPLLDAQTGDKRVGSLQVDDRDPRAVRLAVQWAGVPAEGSTVYLVCYDGQTMTAIYPATFQDGRAVLPQLPAQTLQGSVRLMVLDGELRPLILSLTEKDIY